MRLFHTEQDSLIFFSESYDLKVVYQTDKTGLRNSTWRHSVELNFKHIFLKGCFKSSITQLISLLSKK